MASGDRDEPTTTPDALSRAEALGIFGRSVATGPFDATFDETVTAHVRAAIGSATVLFRLSADGSAFEVADVSHVDPEGATLIRAIFEHDPHGVGDGLLAGLRPEGDALFLSEVDQALLRDLYPLPSHHSYFDRYGLTSLIIVPIAAHGELMGALAVGRGRHEPPFADEDVSFVRALADRAGLALHNVRLLTEATAAAARLTALMEAALDAIVTIDGAGAVLEWNPAAQAVFGWTADEAVGATLGQLIIPEESRLAHQRGLIEANRIGTGPLIGERVEVDALRRDGERFPVELSITPTRVGGVIAYTAFIRDISRRRRSENELVLLARTDPLTGLVNRTELQRVLRTRLVDRGRPAAVLFIDLDDFKVINDEHGHQAGDDVLAAVAQRLTPCVRDDDVVARYGGDEFVVVLNPSGDAPMRQLARVVSRRIDDALSDPIVTAGRAHRLTASIGVGVFPDDATDQDSLLQRADADMYRAKLARRAASP